ncbi:MAG: LamG domain-containing protein [Candidatus Poribacteria bacterium]|nr:LamG domain-containing protein [Candidatus Poribacteria bacterium]
MKRGMMVWTMLIAFAAATNAAGQVVLDGLVGYWPLDPANFDGKDARDVIGENHGVVNGNVKEVAGKVGGAGEFDGQSPIEIEGTEALNFAGKDAFSVSAWVNAASDNRVVGVVASCCGTVVAQRDAGGWALRFDGRNAGQEMEFIVNAGGWQGDGGFGVEKLEAQVWRHLTGTLGDGVMKLYLDGEFQKEMNVGAPIGSNSPETEIGNAAADGGFVGKIDEVMIYNRALTDDEVKQNFNAQGLSVDAAGKAAARWAELKSALN